MPPPSYPPGNQATQQYSVDHSSEIHVIHQEQIAASMSDWSNDELQSLLSDSSLSYSVSVSPRDYHQSAQATAAGLPPPPSGSKLASQLVSPEKVMVRFPGRTLNSLRTLMRELASLCILILEIMSWHNPA